MDNQANFNITRGASFEDIIFRGDYGMLKETSNDEAKVNTMKCQVDETKDLLSYNKISFVENDSDEYECDQVYYQESVVDQYDDRTKCYFN